MIRLQLFRLILMVLALFFAAAVISNLVWAFSASNAIDFLLLQLLYAVLNSLLPVGLVLCAIGLSSYINRKSFSENQHKLYIYSGWLFLTYSIANSIKVFSFLFVSGRKLPEYGQADFANYFVVLTLGMACLALASFVKNAEVLQSENDLTI